MMDQNEDERVDSSGYLSTRTSCRRLVSFRVVTPKQLCITAGGDQHSS